jgi:hypothetical protein
MFLVIASLAGAICLPVSIVAISLFQRANATYRRTQVISLCSAQQRRAAASGQPPLLPRWPTSQT